MNFVNRIDHMRAVGLKCRDICVKMDLDRNVTEEIVLAGYLHDIGYFLLEEGEEKVKHPLKGYFWAERLQLSSVVKCSILYHSFSEIIFNSLGIDMPVVECGDVESTGVEIVTMGDLLIDQEGNHSILSDRISRIALGNLEVRDRAVGLIDKYRRYI